MKIFKRVATDYVSEIDQFLGKLTKDVPLSASQRLEIKKHQRIFKLRDNPQTKRITEKLPEDF